MSRDWLSIAAAAGVAAAAATAFAHARALRREKQALKAELGKWEAEGGNVPQVPTVSPVVTPAASVPPGR